MTTSMYDHKACVKEVASLIERWKGDQVLWPGRPKFRLSASSTQITMGLAACLQNPSIEFEEALDRKLTPGLIRLFRKVFRKKRTFTVKDGVLKLK
jgi:hypothetical protein